MKYRRLFSISVLHDYFSESATAIPEIDHFVDLELTPESRAHVKQCRLQERKKTGQWQLVSPVLDDDSTFLPKTTLLFRYYLKIIRPDFFLFTEIEENQLQNIRKGLEFPQFSSAGQQGELKTEIYRHQAEDLFFIQEEDQKEQPESFFLKSTPIPELKAGDFKITGLNSAPNLQYDKKLKKVSFDTSSLIPEQKFHLAYRAIPQWPSGVFGLIDIAVNGENPSFERRHSIRFSRKQETWQYYIIGKSNIAPDKIKIENGRSGATAPLFGKAVEETGGDLYDRLHAAFPEAKILSIKSNVPLPYVNEPKTRLTLKNGETTLIKHLPNPSPANHGKAIINISS